MLAADGYPDEAHGVALHKSDTAGSGYKVPPPLLR